MRQSRLVFLALMLSLSSVAHAAQPADFLAEFQQQASTDDPGFAGFDAARGATFFTTRHGDWSCSTCHTENPRNAGKHAVTDKTIEPLAPSANAQRFSDGRKVAKWFKRNCNDVLKRVCTAREKGDLLTYLLTLK